jgi:mono/diheme cytochrome c family protein
VLLTLLEAAAVGGAEVARVGLSGPWSVGGWLYANGLTVEETASAQRSGLAAVRLLVGPRAVEPSARRGGRIFGIACAACHAERTMGRRLAGWPGTAIAAAVARLDRLSAASPPFPGDAADREELALHLALLDGSAAGTLPPPDPVRVAKGQRIFAATCAHCHREIRLERRVAGWCEPLAFDVVGRLSRMNAAMPRLELGEEDRRALAAYVVTLGGAR